MAGLGVDLDRLRNAEIEPGLGNGGLGRLAACFVDSLATMNYPAVGYGIRYEYGIFRQTFVEGAQVEQPDRWLANGSPWEFPHPEMAVTVNFGGHTERATDEDGTETVTWVPGWQVLGIPYNYMVPGYDTSNVNTLRLWSARATQAFDLQVFNAGDYLEAVRSQAFAENISKVLYPEDSTPQGKELRLQQQYFFVACSIQDFLTNTFRPDFDLHKLPERVIFQLNDTHPVIAIPELMRILVESPRPGVGGRLGHLPAVLRVHLPHSAAGGAGGVAGRAARAAAAAPHGDHLPDQRGLPGRSAGRVPGRRDEDPQHVDHPGVPLSGGADGQLGHRRRGQGERRRRTAQRAAAGEGAARLRDAVAGQVHERHQRGDAPPVHQAGRPEARRPDHRRHRPRVVARPEPAGRAGTTRRGSRLPRGVRRGQGREQDPAGRSAQRAGRAQDRPDRDVRRDGQAAARVQAAEFEDSCTSSRCTSACRTTPTWTSRPGWCCSARRPRPVT